MDKKSLFEILGLVLKRLWFAVVYDRCQHIDTVKNATITDLDRLWWHQSRKDWHNEEDNGSAYIPIKDDLKILKWSTNDRKNSTQKVCILIWTPAQQRTPAVGPCPTVIQVVGRPGTGSLPSTKSNGIDFDKRLWSPGGANLRAADCQIYLLWLS